MEIFNTFCKYDSWVGPSEVNNIHLESFDLLKEEYNSSLWSRIGIKETDLYGGKVKFKGGIFYKDEKLLFFDLGMIYYKSKFEESKNFFFGTKLSERPIVGFKMRYEFYTLEYDKSDDTINLGGWGYTRVDDCCGINFRQINDEGYEYNRIVVGSYRLRNDGMITIKNKVIHECLQEIQNDIISRKKKKENVEKIKEKKRIDELNNKKGSILDKFDKDKNGTIDVIEDKNEFNLLLKKHQKVVIEKGKEFNQNYTHQFIKVGNYIKQKRSNIQLIFDCIKQVQNQKNLNEYVEILESEIHSYNLLLINSLNLIVSLIEDDQITFYDIYEKFDKLNIFNSNWENEISEKLTIINKGISDLNSNLQNLMYEIRDMGDRIVNSIRDLSYITEESSKKLDNRLGEIESSINVGNLISVINTYQNYKTNRRLNS